MRLLADENFPKPIVEALRAGGHDVLWAEAETIRIISALEANQRERRIYIQQAAG
jgi:hypothetical protein